SVRGTLFAPYGRDADMAGAVYALSLENRTERVLEVRCGVEGTLGYRQLRVRSERAFHDRHRARLADRDVVVLDGAALPGIVALAIAAEESSSATVTDGETPSYQIWRS